MNGCEVKGCKYWSGERCEYDSVNCIFNEQEMDDEIYMNTKPKNAKHHILMCEESYKLLQEENAELRQAKEKAEAEVERLRSLIKRNFKRAAPDTPCEYCSRDVVNCLLEGAENCIYIKDKEGEG